RAIRRDHREAGDGGSSESTMALKKSELYSSLWALCDELRGGMDASQYKDYVLVLLFIKYISDKYAGQPYAPISIPKGATFRTWSLSRARVTSATRLTRRSSRRSPTPTNCPISRTSTTHRSSAMAKTKSTASPISSPSSRT